LTSVSCFTGSLVKTPPIVEQKEAGETLSFFVEPGNSEVFEIMIENLHVGNWIAITDFEPVGDESISHPFFGGGGGVQRISPAIDGRPLKIVAISAPFIAVVDPRARVVVPVDTRTIRWTKLHKKYVQLMSGRDLPGTPEQPHWILIGKLLKNIRNNRSVRTEDKTGLCPICGEKFIQKKTANTDWELKCRQCGFTGNVD